MVLRQTKKNCHFDPASTRCMWIYARKHGPSGTSVATQKNQPCCLSWCSCFTECGWKSTLMSRGARGCAQCPVYWRWLYTCLWIACGCQSSTSQAFSTGTPAPFETFPLLAVRCGPILGAVGRLWACMFFFLPSLHACIIYIYIIPITTEINPIYSGNVSQSIQRTPFSVPVQ